MSVAAGPLQATSCPSLKLCHRSLLLCSFRDMAGFCLGLASIAFWVMAQFPQLAKNYKTQSAEALSAWFLAQWLLVRALAGGGTSMGCQGGGPCRRRGWRSKPRPAPAPPRRATRSTCWARCSRATSCPRSSSPPSSSSAWTACCWCSTSTTAACSGGGSARLRCGGTATTPTAGGTAPGQSGCRRSRQQRRQPAAVRARQLAAGRARGPLCRKRKRQGTAKWSSSSSSRAAQGRRG